MEHYSSILMAAADILDSLGWYGASEKAKQLRYIVRDKWPEDYANEMQWRANPDRKKCVRCDGWADSCGCGEPKVPTAIEAAIQAAIEETGEDQDDG